VCKARGASPEQVGDDMILDLDKYVDFMLDTAWGLLTEGTDPQPMWLLTGAPEKDSVFVNTTWRGPQDKHEFVKVVADMIRADGYTAAVLVSDVWMRDIHVSEGETWDGVAPSESPDRTEAIVANGWDSTGRMLMQVRRYRRKGGGNLTLIEQTGQDTFDESTLESATFAPIAEAIASTRTPGVQ
jgi:hypothetical protein